MAASRATGTPSSLWWLFAGLAAVIGSFTIARFRFFLAGTWDMGVFIQDVWQIAHGGWTNSVTGFHVFADHFSPILIVLAPVAYLSTAEGLLAVQALAVASTVLPAFRLGRRFGGDRLGWLSAAWIGLSANVWHTVMYDFRAATLGWVALVWLISELETKRRAWLIWVLCSVAAAAREDVALFAGVALLIYAALSRTRWLVVPALLAASVGIWYITVGQSVFAPFDYPQWYRFADYGASPGDVIANLDYAVPTALRRLLRMEVVIAVAGLTLPYLILPVLKGWKWSWPAFLIIVSNGVSGTPYIPTIYYHYYLLCTVFLLWGAVYVYQQESWRRRALPSLLVTLSVFLLVGPVFGQGAIPEGRSMADVVSASDRAEWQRELEGIPADAEVSAGDVVLPHLAERRAVHSFPLPMRCSETIVRHTERTRNADYVVLERRERESADIDLPGLGFEALDQDGALEVWRSTSEREVSDQCPSPEENLQNFLDRSRRIAGER